MTGVSKAAAAVRSRLLFARVLLPRGGDVGADRVDDGRVIVPADVYRITIDEWSGKQKVAPADHPSAFLYGQVPPAAASPRVA